jgi:hypothetical protein
MFIKRLVSLTNPLKNLMKELKISVSDKDYDLLTRISKDQQRRLSDLNYLLYAKGLDLFFCETMVSVEKHDNEYTKEDREQQKKNAELEKTEGWSKLDYSERESKGYEHVCSYISNHEYNSKTKTYTDKLIDPLAEKIESYAIEGLTDE